MSSHHPRTRHDRLYYPVWERLKREGECECLIKHPALVNRVRRGIIKEKDEDIAFKLMNEGKFKLYIEYNKNFGVLLFKLSSIEVDLGVAEKKIV
jgi:hypothetical protein